MSMMMTTTTKTSLARPGPRDRSPVRSGFTTVEIITAIAIMAVLSLIFVMAYRHVGASTEANQTQALIDRLKNVVAEATLDRASATRFYSITLPSIYYPDASNDFRNSSYASWVGVPAGSVESLDRTARVVRALMRVPAAKKLFDDLPANQKGVRRVDGEDVVVPLDAWGNVIVFVPDGLQRAVGGGGTVPFTVGSGAGSTEVGGLTNLASASAKQYWDVSGMSPAPTYDPPATAYARPTGFSAYTGTGSAPIPTLRAPDHRPFWFSPGPGEPSAKVDKLSNYATHDDNLYSFQN